MHWFFGGESTVLCKFEIYSVERSNIDHSEVSAEAWLKI